MPPTHKMRLHALYPSFSKQGFARSCAERVKREHAQEAGNLSVLFDMGGIAGGALAGALSDTASAPACVSAAFVFGSVPLMCAVAGPCLAT